MGKFDEYVTGKMEMNVGGLPLELDVTIKDKRKLKTIAGKDGLMSEENLETMDNTFLDILKRSYPEEAEDKITNYYMKNDLDFMQQFFVKVGWAKQEDFDKKKE